ncbi:MAG: DUF707 domain-containing protein [Casimicrobiaceae bacterium]
MLPMHPHKRFLVIVRAGDRSLHPQWTRSEQTRNWDLVVSYYGQDGTRYRSPGVHRIDDPGPKLPGLHALLTREAMWRDYDYVWLPDDDLAVTESAINRLFETISAHGLALAQPALSWISFFSHQLTLRSPSFRLRFTNFVEIMAPCFRRDFLHVCLPTMSENRSGWGLDYLWPRLLPADHRLCAILDEIEITHTRPVGGPNYDALRSLGVTPGEELLHLFRRHRLPEKIEPTVSAAIDTTGTLLSDASGPGAEALRRMRADDFRAFLASRLRLDLPSVLIERRPAGAGTTVSEVIAR